MTLIKSISGIRGTIGGKVGENLTPIDAVKFGCAYGSWLKDNSNDSDISVVIGRDARISGEMIQNLVQNSLISLGINVVDLGLSTTPTVELMVKEYNASGGIVITASHNPAEWNALKLLDKNGEFLNSQSGEEIIKISENDSYVFSEINDLGIFFSFIKNWIQLTLTHSSGIRLTHFFLIESKTNILFSLFLIGIW